ncbi:MAG: response regulator [Vampirovibrionales bacterium]|nr:response regulator [Vampirovibrionales bacterium]
MIVLSVDDSAIIRRFIQGAVEVMGLDFAGVEHGQAALDYLREHANDVCLVLLDWNMPVLDGFSTLQKLQSDPDLKQIPVMMVTTETERTNIVKAIQAGAKNYLTKPFSQEDLMIKMNECLAMTV